MKRTFQLLLIFFIVCLSLNLQPKGVQAFPPLPSSFYGTVKLNGVKVADGTLVEAVVNGKVFAQSYTQMYEGDSVYTISVPGDDPSTTTVDGAKEGDTISFKIGGIEAQQTGTWHGATNVKLDLSAVTAVTPNTPAPTPTSYPTQTAIPTQNTPVPSFTPMVNPTLTTNPVQNTSAPSQTSTGITAPPAGGSTTSTPFETLQGSGPETITASAQPQSGKTGTASEPGSPVAEKPAVGGLILLGAGILVALIAFGWLFIRQMKR